MRLTLIENFRAVFYTPFYAAFALQAYEAEGLEVRRISSSQPAETMQALLRGQGDVAWGGPIRLLTAYNRQDDAGLVIFCDVIGRDPFFLLGRTPHPAFHPRDLLDVRLATVSEVPTPWLCLQHDLRLAGLDPDKVRRLADRSMPENVEALRAGDVDVIQVFQPFAEQVLDEQIGHIWYAAADRGATAYTALYATRAFLEQQPESLLRMTQAMYRTQQWIAAHDAAQLAALVTDYFPAVPVSRLTGALARYKALGLWNRTPIMPPEGFAWLSAACVSGGFIGRNIAYEQCVDMRFAAQAVQSAASAAQG